MTSGSSEAEFDDARIFSLVLFVCPASTFKSNASAQLATTSREIGKTEYNFFTDFRNITVLKVFDNVCSMLLLALSIILPSLV